MSELEFVPDDDACLLKAKFFFSAGARDRVIAVAKDWNKFRN